MKKITISIISIAILFLGGIFLWSTSSQKPKTDHVVKVDHETTSSIKKINTSTKFYDISADLPNEDLSGGMEVRSYINNKVDDFIARANQDAPKMGEKFGEQVQFTQDIRVATSITKNLTSYKVTRSLYFGGATSDIRVDTFVFNNKGERLSSTDLIDKEEEFLQVVRDAVYEKYGADSDNSNDVFATAENIVLDGLKIYVTKKEIRVVFSKYEIAPGAAGVIEISVPSQDYLN